jgi:hypothetical protein
MRGGKRPGAGRKLGSVSAAKARMQQTAKDVAAQVLSEVDAVAIWKKLILQQDKPQVAASVMEYLTDRVYGRPTQTIQGNPRQPVTIQLQWSSTPEWLPSVTVNQQVNHIATSTDRAEEIGQKTWRVLKGSPLLRDVYDGKRFVDGEVSKRVQKAKAVAA